MIKGISTFQQIRIEINTFKGIIYKLVDKNKNKYIMSKGIIYKLVDKNRNRYIMIKGIIYKSVDKNRK